MWYLSAIKDTVRVSYDVVRLYNMVKEGQARFSLETWRGLHVLKSHWDRHFHSIAAVGGYFWDLWAEPSAEYKV